MRHAWSYCLAVLLPVVVACTTAGAGNSARPVHTVEAFGKVVDSLAGEATRRAGDEGYRGLPVVVSPSGQAANAVEFIVAEFLRTRLLERGMVVHKSCTGKCLEITLQEFGISVPVDSQLTPGQILIVATGSVPVLGSLTRSLGEREREAERAAARTTGLLATFAARDGDRYTARGHVVAIVSASSGEVALEQK